MTTATESVDLATKFVDLGHPIGRVVYPIATSSYFCGLRAEETFRTAELTFRVGTPERFHCETSPALLHYVIGRSPAATGYDAELTATAALRHRSTC